MKFFWTILLLLLMINRSETATALEDVFLESLPEDVVATMEARDRFFARGDVEGLGDKFFFDDLQAWQQHANIRIAFMGGNSQLHKEIAEATTQITDNCNLTFDFGHDAATATYRTWSTSDTSYVADIRVSFDQAGFFSLVGRDSVTPSIGDPLGAVGGRPHQCSLNLGGFHIQRPADWAKVVRHEFLHAIAFKHEHQSPMAGCDAQFRWDDDTGYIPTQDADGRYIENNGKRPGIYTYLSGAPNFWGRSKVDHNLRQHASGSGSAGTFDRESIMLYRFPKLFYVSVPNPCMPLGAGINLSAGDIAGLDQLYPKNPGTALAAEVRQELMIESLMKVSVADDQKSVGERTEQTSSVMSSHLPTTLEFAAVTSDKVMLPEISEEDRIKDQLRAHRVKLYYEEGTTLDKTAGPKIVYGADDRIDVLRLAVNSLERRLAASTCLLTSKSRILAQNGAASLFLEDYRFGGLPPCGRERFAAQKTGGWCSGFLVGPDLICTAGHCCEPTDANVQEIAFVFGFYAANDPTQSTDVDSIVTPTALNENQVYFGNAVIAHRLSSTGDFAIVRLDRPVTFPGAAPLEVSSANLSTGENIGMVGHPSGLPAKAAFGAETKIFDVQTTWLKTNLDAYGGNSGSAVFDTTGKVVGILVRGNQDFRIHDNECFFTNQVADSQAGEMATRASVFRNEIPAFVPAPESVPLPITNPNSK